MPADMFLSPEKPLTCRQGTWAMPVQATSGAPPPGCTRLGARSVVVADVVASILEGLVGGVGREACGSKRRRRKKEGGGEEGGEREPMLERRPSGAVSKERRIDHLNGLEMVFVPPLPAPSFIHAFMHSFTHGVLKAYYPPRQVERWMLQIQWGRFPRSHRPRSLRFAGRRLLTEWHTGDDGGARGAEQAHDGGPSPSLGTGVLRQVKVQGVSSIVPLSCSRVLRTLLCD